MTFTETVLAGLLLGFLCFSIGLKEGRERIETDVRDAYQQNITMEQWLLYRGVEVAKAA